MTRSCLHKKCPNQFISAARRWTQTAGFLVAFASALLAVANHLAAEENVTPFKRALNTPKGTLESPYQDPTSVAAEGLQIYRSLDCNGCHGGGGGGGMAAPLTNPVWIYGNDDDTLFRVIALGTGSLSPGNAFEKQGYRRVGSEAVVGPMPPYGEIIESDDEIWKIIAWIKSKNLVRDQ